MSKQGRSSGTYLTFYSSGNQEDVYQLELVWIPLPGTGSPVTREQVSSQPNRIIVAFNVPIGNGSRGDWFTTQTGTDRTVFSQDLSQLGGNTERNWRRIGTANASILSNMISQMGTHQLLLHVQGSQIRVANMSNGQDLLTLNTTLPEQTEGLHLISALMFTSTVATSDLPGDDVMVSFLSLPPNNPLCRQCSDCTDVARKARNSWMIAFWVVLGLLIVIVILMAWRMGILKTNAYERGLHSSAITQQVVRPSSV